jgi:hypothetical protein
MRHKVEHANLTRLAALQSPPVSYYVRDSGSAAPDRCKTRLVGMMVLKRPVLGAEGKVIMKYLAIRPATLTATVLPHLHHHINTTITQLPPPPPPPAPSPPPISTVNDAEVSHFCACPCCGGTSAVSLPSCTRGTRTTYTSSAPSLSDPT